MSKKKSFSGSTMTLKDFHGGSIPSDIPLPSAPGVMVRPTDRPVFDRQGSWGNPMGRPDHRLRPSSSGSMRSLDDKSPFLTNTAHIGRNFDEDERKPLDGISGPRRTVSDETIGAPPMRMEFRSHVGRSTGNQVSVPSQHVYNPSGGPYSARVAEPVHMGPVSWSSGGGTSSGSHPNAWAVRKEVVCTAELTPSPYDGQSSISKFAQASALDKVSSGRWQTKPIHHQADVEVIRQVESPNSLHPRGSDAYHGFNSMNEREYSEKFFARHAERALSLEDSIQNVAKEAPSAAGERIKSPILLDAKERASVISSGGGQANPDGKYGTSGLQTQAEALERPKLKLLPRTKPLEATEQSTAEYKQQPSDSTHMETSNETIVNSSHVKPGLSAGVEEERQLVERPKLNLKPRSQPLEQTVQSAERVRMTLFGGARPRELVLKQRGADDVVNNQEVVQSPVRIKKDSPRAETIPVHSNAVRRSEKPENVGLDHRTGKITDRREHRTDTEKSELQRKNWRNENWRNSRDSEKQPQAQHQQERPPSPETWRKPVDQPKPANADGSGLRFGKAVSALELAQAFSKSVSDPKPNAGQFTSPKGVPGPKGVPAQKGVPTRTQVPFSRLTGSTTRPQINGY